MASNEVESLADKLAVLTSRIYNYHDNRSYGDLEETSAEYLQLLGVSRDAAKEGGKMVSKMYELSDEADLHLLQGNRALHDQIFSHISEEAKRLDRLIGLKRGSISDEIRWWYHFRLAFDKSSHRAKRRYHMSAAYWAVFLEHYRRLGSISYALKCTSELGHAGLAHKVRDNEKESHYLKMYYSTKVKGNKNRAAPELFSM